MTVALEPPKRYTGNKELDNWLYGIYKQLLSADTAIGAVIPSGSVMVFYQAAAPTGWTQVTTQNDKALRIVSASGGGVGGTHGLSSPPSTAHTHTGPSHQHTGPSHTHTAPAHQHTGPSHSHTYTTVIAHQHGFSTSADGIHTHEFRIGQATGTPDSPRSGWSYGSYSNYNIGSNNLIQNSASHSHTGTTNSTGSGSGTTSSDGTGLTGVAGGSATSSDGTGLTGAAGVVNTSSNGPTAFAPQYIDVILCSKD